MNTQGRCITLFELLVLPKLTIFVIRFLIFDALSPKVRLFYFFGIKIL